MKRFLLSICALISLQSHSLPSSRIVDQQSVQRTHSYHVDNRISIDKSVNKKNKIQMSLAESRCRDFFKKMPKDRLLEINQLHVEASVHCSKNNSISLFFPNRIDFQLILNQLKHTEELQIKLNNEVIKLQISG